MTQTADEAYLPPPQETPAVQELYAEDLAGDGFVMNLTRVWAHAPALQERMTALLADAGAAAGLSFRQRGVLVTATASAREDSYCSLAWGTRLAGELGEEAAAAVLQGDDGALEPADRALARWARQVARDPNRTSPDDVRGLREAGFDDAQILALTVYVAGRMAFSAVNGALGARPDAEYRALAPDPVLSAVDYGRPLAGGEEWRRGESNP